MSKLGKRLIQSAEEAVAIAEGRLKPARVVTAEKIDVSAIRGKMKLSQDKFAQRFHLAAATVRDWEQKRRTPDRIAANLLRVIEYAPETVARALGEKNPSAAKAAPRRSNRVAGVAAKRV